MRRVARAFGDFRRDTRGMLVCFRDSERGLRRYPFLRTERRDAVRWAELVSCAGPLVGAAALTTSRLGIGFAGFPEPLAILATTHFHFTFGVLPAVAGALTRRPGMSSSKSGYRYADAALYAVVFMPPVVGALFATREQNLVPGAAEAGATVALAAAVCLWALAAGKTVGNAGRLGLAMIASATALGAVYATTLRAGRPFFDLGGMLRCHGIGNAIGAVLLTVAARRVARFAGIPEPAPRIDRTAEPRDIDESRALFVDDISHDMGEDAGDRFDMLAASLLRYRFYPRTVMVWTSDFAVEEREARVGDRIGMALAIPVFPKLPPLFFPATTEVAFARRDADVAEFGYVATRAHYGRGLWRATLERSGGRIRLRIRSRISPRAFAAILGLPVYRFLQLRARRLGVENFKKCIP